MQRCQPYQVRPQKRAGRIDRIGTSFATLWVQNMFPDEGLEKLLGLVESLSRKIASIDQSGFLDASILGEIVHPQNFNTLRRIEEEDGKVVEEQEKVIQSIVQSSVEQVAVEEAPRQLDPIQQTISTVLRSYINNPAISHKKVIAAIQQLNLPLPGVYVKTLRRAYDAFTATAQVDELLAAVQSISQEKETSASASAESKTPVRREDLKLICFDYVWQ